MREDGDVGMEGVEQLANYPLAAGQSQPVGACARLSGRFESIPISFFWPAASGQFPAAMSLLLWIISFTLLGGAVSALAASLFLLIPERNRARVLPHLVSFATGALLGAALIVLLPHAVQEAGAERMHTLGLTLLFGILVFFLLEKFVLWRHCHVEVCEGHEDHHAHAPVTNQHRDAASARLVLMGDGFHNILDGVLIAAAFMTDVHLGIVTAIAVIVH
jgi:zinc and cadmium transporter